MIMRQCYVHDNVADFNNFFGDTLSDAKWAKSLECVERDERRRKFYRFFSSRRQGKSAWDRWKGKKDIELTTVNCCLERSFEKTLFALVCIKINLRISYTCGGRKRKPKETRNFHMRLKPICLQSFQSENPCRRLIQPQKLMGFKAPRN